MTDTGARVVLLARPGEASTRLEAALREAGAAVALVADPTVVDVDAIRAVSPQALLVALEPEVEDALDRFESLLVDPDLLVIFDEAELAAQREGWDAARWSRHLAAKLHRHEDVLPPGAESDGEWQPAPGALSAGLPALSAEDLAILESAASELAADVPRDDAFEIVFEPLVLDDDGGDDGDSGVLRFAPDAIGPDLSESPFEAIATDGLMAAEDMDWSSSANAVDPAAVEIPDDAVLAFETQSFETMALDAVADADADVPGVDDASRLDAGQAGADALLASSSLSLDEPGAVPSARPETPAIDATLGDSLSLAEDDGPIAAPSAAPSHDVAALEARASGLSLADADSYGHGTLRGAVVVEGGLGGPDAVRQLLADLPEDFPRAVLVRLQLDGGRYDRLVKQMQRASRLAVLLAEADAVAEPSQVYFLPPEITVVADRARLVFATSDDATGGLHAVLPAGDTAWVFLSGSDAALVDGVATLAPQGALLAAQTPESCYDGTAPARMIERGGHGGSPVELAGRLVERWPS